jgi:hypothetical protein
MAAREQPSVGRGLLDRAARQPRRLLRALVLGDAIAERTDTTRPPSDPGKRRPR